MSRYEVVEVIGRGATSVVYRAVDTLLDRPVALKEVHFEAAADLALAEARAVARISHPNVVTVHDIYVDADRRMIAMELLEGPTLRRMLDTEGALGFDKAMNVAGQVAASLAAAHAVGVVHRDVKPDNVFVVKNGRVVVSDFGLASSELRGGTPGYMAPEQWNDEVSGPAGDVFAWACVLAECLTGTPPFGVSEAESRDRTLAGRASHRLGWPELEELVARCLATSPAARPQDGTALVAELHRLGGLATVPAAAATRRAPVTPVHSAAVPVRPARFGPSAGAGLALLVYPSDGGPWWATVEPGAAVEIGREAHVLLLDPLASRRHARIEWDGRGWTVSDLGSLNGTLLNGRPIEHAAVEAGDVLTIGTTVIRVEDR